MRHRLLAGIGAENFGSGAFFRAWPQMLFVLVLFVPIVADLLPGLYCAGIVIAGLELGWKDGLAAGVASGIFHAAIGCLFWGGLATGLEVQLLAFLVVGFALIQQRRHGAGTRNPRQGSAVESPGQAVRGDDYLEQVFSMASELSARSGRPSQL